MLLSQFPKGVRIGRFIPVTGDHGFVRMGRWRLSCKNLYPPCAGGLKSGTLGSCEGEKNLMSRKPRRSAKTLRRKSPNTPDKSDAPDASHAPVTPPPDPALVPVLSAGWTTYQEGHLAQAADMLAAACIDYPASAEAHHMLGVVLLELGRPGEALKSLVTARDLDPGRPGVHDDMGALFFTQGYLGKALESYEKALACDGARAETHNNLGAVYTAMGDHENALASYRKALELDPGMEMAQQNIILSLDYLPHIDIETRRNEWARWCGRFATPTPIPDASALRPHDNDRDPERRLRVGYVSADFKQHSAARVFGGVLAHHDHDAVEVICYSGVRGEDEQTARFRDMADHWRGVFHLSDHQLADMVREDGVDILVDLSGHSGGNRLSLFARRPAPLQVTAWGYAAGTGLAAMDYLFADECVIPPPETGNYEETIVHLPCLFVAEPPADLPPVGPLLALTQNAVTFGSFNRLPKLTETTLALWAEVLAAVPESRLVLKCAEFNDQAQRRRIAGFFADRGIEDARVEMMGKTPQREHLEAYARVDVGLDTAPYGGGVTTLDALWMGCRW